MYGIPRRRESKLYESSTGGQHADYLFIILRLQNYIQFHIVDIFLSCNRAISGTPGPGGDGSDDASVLTANLRREEGKGVVPFEGKALPDLDACSAAGAVGGGGQHQ
jgi:hypothetical protein